MRRKKEQPVSSPEPPEREPGLFPDSPGLLTVEQMSRLLQVSNKTGYKLVEKGLVQSFRIGACLRIPKASLEAYVTAHLEAASV